MTGQELLREAEKLCRRYDVWSYHAHRPQWDRRGLPDLLMLGTIAGAFREIKAGRDKLSPEQRQVGQRMIAAGWDWDTWQVRDLDSGRIEREIAALSGKQPWVTR